ncbi:MAG: ERF family protein [Petrotogales bacterium]
MTDKELEEKNKNIYQKLLNIQKKVKNIPKNGYNSYSRYYYVDKDTLYDYMRSYFQEENLFVLTTDENHERQTIERKDDKRKTEFINSTIITQKHIVVNINNPDEKVEFYSKGLGVDKTDKDLYQASTGAMKYFLINNFFISGGDSFPADVEHDSNERQTNNNSQSENEEKKKDRVNTEDTQSKASELEEQIKAFLDKFSGDMIDYRTQGYDWLNEKKHSIEKLQKFKENIEKKLGEHVEGEDISDNNLFE